MNINPGELNRKIQILRMEDAGTNENGFPMSEEVVVREPWAKITHKSGSELIAEHSEFAVDKTRFLIRFSKTPIDTDCFVRYDGHDYDIVYINDYEEAHEYLEIWCERRARV